MSKSVRKSPLNKLTPDGQNWHSKETRFLLAIKAVGLPPLDDNTLQERPIVSTERVAISLNVQHFSALANRNPGFAIFRHRSFATNRERRSTDSQPGVPNDSNEHCVPEQASWANRIKRTAGSGFDVTAVADRV